MELVHQADAISFQAFKTATAPHLRGKSSADVDAAVQVAWEKSGYFQYAKKQNGKVLPVPESWKALAAQYVQELAPKSKATTAPAPKPAA